MSKTKARRLQEEKQKLISEALELLKSRHIFARYFDLMERCGLVGEKRNAAVLTIAAVSRLLDNPLNVIVKGRSSSGKNFLVNRALLPVPRDAIRELTSSSAAAWHYSHDDFRHRIVYLQERNEASGAIHPVRLLISEGKLIRIVTVTEGGIRRSKQFVARGPVASISTTTRGQLEIDDETRHVSLWVDESPEQTKRILLANSVDRVRIPRRKILIWRTVHKLLAERAASYEVVLPRWFRQVAETVYAEDVIVRRYFPAFLTACKAIALLRSFQPDEDHGVKNRLEVSFVDFAIAAILFDPVFVESLNRGDDEVLHTRAVIEQLARARRGAPVTATQLAKRLEVSKNEAYARLRSATEAGAIRRANKPEKNNRKLYLPEKHPNFLPNPEQVFQRITELGKRSRFVHPLTDELVIYERNKRRDRKN